MHEEFEKTRKKFEDYVKFLDSEVSQLDELLEELRPMRQDPSIDSEFRLIERKKEHILSEAKTQNTSLWKLISNFQQQLTDVIPPQEESKK